MVEYYSSLDSVFGALADQTRRDILSRLISGELTVGEIAEPYKLTFAAVSKHLKVLEKAKLIAKQRRGKQQVIRLNLEVLMDVEEYIRQYHKLWAMRLDSLDMYLQSINKKGII